MSAREQFWLDRSGLLQALWVGVDGVCVARAEGDLLSSGDVWETGVWC